LTKVKPRIAQIYTDLLTANVTN